MNKHMNKCQREEEGLAQRKKRPKYENKAEDSEPRGISTY